MLRRPVTRPVLVLASALLATLAASGCTVDRGYHDVKVVRRGGQVRHVEEKTPMGVFRLTLDEEGGVVYEGRESSMPGVRALTGLFVDGRKTRDLSRAEIDALLAKAESERTVP